MCGIVYAKPGRVPCGRVPFYQPKTPGIMQRIAPQEAINAVSEAVGKIVWKNVSDIVDVLEEIELLVMQYEKHPITKTNAVYQNAMGLISRRCGENGRPLVEALNKFVTHDT